jgi:hypothetical protein
VIHTPLFAGGRPPTHPAYQLLWWQPPTSETSVDIQLRTQQYIPEDSELHICETVFWVMQ